MAWYAAKMHGQKMVHVSMKKSQPSSTAVCRLPIDVIAIYTQSIDRGGIYIYKLGD